MNVLGYDTTTYTLRISNNVYKPGTETVILLVISQEEKRHYCVVKDWSRL